MFTEFDIDSIDIIRDGLRYSPAMSTNSDRSVDKFELRVAEEYVSKESLSLLLLNGWNKCWDDPH